MVCSYRRNGMKVDAQLLELLVIMLSLQYRENTTHLEYHISIFGTWNLDTTEPTFTFLTCMQVQSTRRTTCAHRNKMTTHQCKYTLKSSVMWQLKLFDQSKILYGMTIFHKVLQ